MVPEALIYEDQALTECRGKNVIDHEFLGKKETANSRVRKRCFRNQFTSR